MSDESEMRIVNVPLDTALFDEVARENGYRDLADLQEKAEAERAALPPGIADLCDEIGREVEAKILGLEP